MVDAVNEIPDIVEVACYSGKLGIALGIAERCKDLSCRYCYASDVGKAMLGIAERFKRGVGSLYIGADRFIFFYLFVGYHLVLLYGDGVYDYYTAF